MNTVNRIVTYFSRSNTDCTSLLSGTAVKAVIAYVSDYVSKIGLKSYQAFASVFDVFERNTDNLADIGVSETATKRILRQMVNSMSTKMEIGSPMASMYLLGNPDHYASHTFVNFPWRTYVTYVKKFWSITQDPSGMDEAIPEDNIVLRNTEGTIRGSSIIDDYTMRPLIYESVTLYEWVQSHKKAPFTKVEKEATWTVEDSDETIVQLEAKHIRENKFIKHSFVGDHKEKHTHGVYCDFSRLENIIPNFLGGAIPRSDKGDREYYCMSI
ncbi:hypothetical protein B0H13DRAFT_1621552, partial [Mycena leptocephala]